MTFPQNVLEWLFVFVIQHDGEHVKYSWLQIRNLLSWWRHQMETFSVLLAICAGNSPFPREFPSQRPAMRSFGVFFDLRQEKRLRKQSWGWWFETLWSPLWHHSKVCRLQFDRQPAYRWLAFPLYKPGQARSIPCLIVSCFVASPSYQH